MAKVVKFVNESFEKIAIRRVPWIASMSEEIVGFVKRGDTLTVVDESAVVYDWVDNEFVEVSTPYTGYINKQALEAISQNG